MIQHLLLTMVAAPLLALGAPITLLCASSRRDTRRRLILPRAPLVPRERAVVPGDHLGPSSPRVMWASHFSPLFDAALESEPAHLLEHALFLGSALLFWWPVVGADPSPWRLAHPARIAYLFLGMPQSSFLGLAIFSAPGRAVPALPDAGAILGPVAARGPATGRRASCGSAATCSSWSD